MDFEIIGTVIERGTRKPLQGLRVEAWDRDTRYHDMLGSAITDGAGRFRMRFTDEYFGDFRPDRLPDVFYRVFRDDGLVLSTQDEPSMNVPGPVINITLELEPVIEPEVRRDRVDVETALKAVTFFRGSDFGGIRREAGDQFKLAGGFLGRMFANTFKEWDWSPVTPSNVKRTDVVNRDIQSAQVVLAEKQVTVDRVEPFDPKVSRNSVQLLTSLPANLQPGERVVLYEEGGQVKFFARVREEKVASIDQLEVQRLSQELAGVKSEINAVRALRNDVDTLKATTTQERDATVADLSEVRMNVAELAEMKRTIAAMQNDINQRNQTIAGLQAELGTVRAKQDRIERTDLLQRVTAVERKLEG